MDSNKSTDFNLKRRVLLKASCLGVVAAGLCTGLSSVFAGSHHGSHQQRWPKPSQWLRLNRISLKAPEFVGNTGLASVSLQVYSRAEDDNFVQSVIILAEKNSEPEVFKYHCEPHLRLAAVSTRILIAKSQKIVAVAKISDGTLLTTSKTIRLLSDSSPGKTRIL